MSLDGFERELCNTFCEKLSFRKVPVGAAIGTPFIKADGDKVGFYLVETEGGYRLEDDGDTIPALEAMGVDFSNGPRAEALGDMFKSYSVTYDEADCVIRSPVYKRESLAKEALQFAGLILRLQDFVLLTRERVEDTFKSDVIAAVNEAFSIRARVTEGYVPHPSLSDLPADIGIIAQDADPVALFIATGDSKALEATLAWLKITFELKLACKVAMMIDDVSTKKVRKQTLQRAMNSFPVMVFRGEEENAIRALERAAFPRDAWLQ